MGVYFLGSLEFRPHELGDTFGLINTLFSGLAFAGVIAAILLQSVELRHQREELDETQRIWADQNRHLKDQAKVDTATDIIAKWASPDMIRIRHRAKAFLHLSRHIPMNAKICYDGSEYDAREWHHDRVCPHPRRSNPVREIGNDLSSIINGNWIDYYFDEYRNFEDSENDLAAVVEFVAYAGLMVRSCKADSEMIYSAIGPGLIWLFEFGLNDLLIHANNTEWWEEWDQAGKLISELYRNIRGDQPDTPGA